MNNRIANLTENESQAVLELKEKVCIIYPEAVFILYGSKARRDFEDFSDIDVLILLDKEVDRALKETISHIAYDIELKYDVVISTIIESNRFWNSHLAQVMPFHENVEREGILI